MKNKMINLKNMNKTRYCKNDFCLHLGQNKEYSLRILSHIHKHCSHDHSTPMMNRLQFLIFEKRAIRVREKEYKKIKKKTEYLDLITHTSIPFFSF